MASRRSYQAGVASVEAMILLPTLLLLYFGILYVARVNDAKLVALTEARGQAWTASMQACEGAPTAQNQQHPESRSVSDQVGKSLAVANQSSQSSTKPPIGGVVGKLLEAPLKALFGESVTTSVSKTVSRPVYLGREQVTVVGSYRLPCNIKPQSLWDIASSLWDSFL